MRAVRMFLLGAVAVCSVLAPFAGEALAFELFGRCFFGACKTDEAAGAGLIDPKTYTVDFKLEEGDARTLEDAIKSASELWRGRDDPIAGSAGLAARAKGDYQRLLAALYDQGYYGGSISILVNGGQAAEIGPGAEFPGTSQVVVRITPGALYRFGKTSIVNRAPPATNRRDIVALPENEGFVPGAPAKASVIRKSGALAREAWRQQGYPKAGVRERRATAIHPEDRLEAQLTIAPGPHAVFGPIGVQGTERMDPAFVAWMTGFEAGREYDPDDVKKAIERLDRLDVFSLRKIEEADAVGPNGALPLSLLVKEKKLRRIGAGGSVSSLDGAGVTIYWLHRNLFGRAERLKLDAKISGLGATIDYKEFDYLIGATFGKPGMLTPDTDLVADLIAKREFNDAFTETSTGTSATLNHTLSDRLTLKGGPFANLGRFDDAFDERTFLTTGILAGVTYDSRDDGLEPKRGFYTRFEGKPFFEWKFGNGGIRAEAEARAYFAFDDDGRAIVAGRVKIGSLLGSPIDETPANLRFLAGGGGSVRGYGFRRIGVTAPNGQLTGGRSLFEASLELRGKLTKSVGIVAFADAGTVGADSLVDFSDEPKIGVGAGLRYYTSLGALRLDAAVPLNADRGEGGFTIYAGIGQAF